MKRKKIDAKSKPEAKHSAAYLQKKVACLEKRLADKEWASKKTNEGIKILYKELQEKNRKLLVVDQLKSDFVSIVSHELRTPLSIVKEGINLIREEVLGRTNEKQNRILRLSSSNIERLERIINDLLDVSKIEAGKAKVKRTRVSVNNIVDQVAVALEARAAEKGLEIRKRVSGDDVALYADRDKLVQIFTNLINNSMRFTQNGYIQIAVKDKEEEIEFELADTGIGIKEADLPKVFSKFEQFGRVNGPGEKGTGLGLAIVKGIIELHHGRIWVSSEYGKGTRFTFVLPKVTYDGILTDYLENAIKKAKENEARISLVVISIKELLKLKEEVAADKIGNFVKDIEGLIKNSLRRAEDIILSDTDEMAIIIACNKEDALRVTGRVRRTLENYLGSWNLIDKARVRFGCATYPDDGNDDEALVAAARQHFEIY